MMVPNAAFRPMESRSPEALRWARWEGADVPALPRGPSLVARLGAWWTRVRAERAPRMLHAQRAANEQAASQPSRTH